MKHRALFSLKDKSKKIYSVGGCNNFLLCALRVKEYRFVNGLVCQYYKFRK